MITTATPPQPMTPYQARRHHTRQRGVALLVALIMITLVSILGISAMRGAVIENRLANNSLLKELTFQSAESASDIVMSEASTLENLICQPPIVGRNVPEVNLHEKQKTTVDVEYSGFTNAIGFSLGNGVGVRRFLISGNSEIPGVSTGTTISQGVVLVGASITGVEC